MADAQSRALAALDAAFADSIGQHFATLIGQEAGDGDNNAKGDAARFEAGLVELRAAYLAAIAIVEKVFGGAS